MRVCPVCRTGNAADARFCQGCGRALVAPVGPSVADAAAALADPTEPERERLLWQGRPSWLVSPRLGLTNRYKLTNERLMIEHGFVGRRTEEIDLYRVHDVGVVQTPIERITGLGDVLIITSDRSARQKRLANIRDPDRIKNLIRDAARAERQRRRVLLRDEV